MLEWARVQGCPWSETTCERAAAGGHIEVLEWARANGCLLDEFTSKIAAGVRNMEDLEWVKANGCLTSSATYASGDSSVDEGTELPWLGRFYVRLCFWGTLASSPLG